MARKQTEQINFRCSPVEREAYTQLAEELGVSLAVLIRKFLNTKVLKVLGAEWLKEDE